MSAEEERCKHHGVPLASRAGATLVRSVTAGSVASGPRAPAEDAYCRECENERQHLHLLAYGDRGLRFCGCGQPDAVWMLVREMLESVPFRADDQADAAMFYALLYWLDGTDLIDHGTMITGSWLTEKGKHYLPLMRRHDWDQVAEAGFPHDGDECPVTCEHWIASHAEWQRKAIIEEREAKPPDPQEPIPSDDPRCNCSRTPRSGWSFMKVTGATAHEDAKNALGGPSPLWLEAGCPHHGGIVRQMDRVAR